MASSNGKIILLGEHAVVYGVPAIAAGFSAGAQAVAQRCDGGASALRLGERSLTLDDVDPEHAELREAFGQLLAELKAPPVRVRVTLAMPAGVGLGASAAIAVAIARAVLELLGNAGDPGARTQAVLRAATAWEQVFHGNPSGIDAAAAAFGGCIRFRRGIGPEPLHVGEPLHLALAVAGPPASTKLMVDGVRRLGERRPDVLAKSLEAIRSLVANAVTCIAEGDSKSLGELLNLNQMLLSGLMVSTPEIEEACHTARDAGALGAKLTGAGGGGCVLALARNEAGIQTIREAWQRTRLETFATIVPAS